MIKLGITIVVAAVVVIAAIPLTHRKDAPTSRAPQSTQTYVAFGDSVAAGVGLKTDSDSSACNRTNQSYPNVVAQRQNLKLTNLACSGATLPSGILGKQDVNQLLIAPQLDQLYKQRQPKFVSLTIGANDADWTGSIGKCYTGACGTAADTAAVQDRLEGVRTNLRTLLDSIHTHYASPPVVFITGYYQVFPTNGSPCSDLNGIDADELVWGRQQQTSLNDAITSTISGFSNVHYVPIDYSGHELCTSNPWVQALADKQPYHPTEAGQTAIADAIAMAMKASSPK